MVFATYKIQPRNVSCEKVELKRLIDYVIQKTRETHDAHRRDLNLEGQTDDEKNATYKTLDEAYRAAVFVYGAEGEELGMSRPMLKM